MDDQQDMNEAADCRSALTAEFGNEPYIIDFSIKHNGWCIFKSKDELSMEFHAGAFNSRAAAQSECKRLNDLVPNASGNPTTEAAKPL